MQPRPHDQKPERAGTMDRPANESTGPHDYNDNGDIFRSRGGAERSAPDGLSKTKVAKRTRRGQK
jgi:hypothetical protein